MNPAQIEATAIVCHQTNKAYCEMLGDKAQVDWEDAPTWQTDSAIAGVEAIVNDPGMTPEDSHRGWLEHKINDGWTYGPVKDAELKTHPCMVPYDELPMEQRFKDILFRTVVLACMQAYQLTGA